MSEALIHSPKPDDEDWGLFERGRENGDIGLISQLRIDATLRKIRIAAQDMTPAQLDELAKRAEEHLRIASELTDYETTRDPLEYFHLKTKLALIEQIVFAQHTFSKKELYGDRRKLVDGTYGSISEVLEEALDRFDATPDEAVEEKAQLTGAITEITALAFLDHPEKPERLAVPSDVTSDLYYATDLELFTLPKTRETGRVYHTQVKTGRSRRVRMPFGGILIRAADMSNAPDSQGVMFPSSRSIVSDVNATETKASVAHLERATKEFEARLALSVRQADRQLDAFERLPVELKGEAVQIMGKLITRMMDENPDASTLDISIYEP